MSDESKEIFIIDDAKRSDCASILEMIKELAKYENMLDQVELTCQKLEEDGFGDCHHPRFRSIVIRKTSDDQLIGYLMYVQKYSTFKGPFLWIEDLYIKPEYRRSGLGRSLSSVLVRKAKKQNMKRIEWNVLEWNQSAINFYRKKLGAFDMTDQEKWHTYRLDCNRFDQLIDIDVENVQIFTT